MNSDRIEIILDFWFGKLPDDKTFPDEKAKLWFAGGEAFNETIRRQFGEDLKLAEAGQLDSWEQTPRGRLALIILLDQFTRNAHGDSPACFAQDAKALAIAIDGIMIGHDRKLRPVERTFYYMPFEHSEDIKMQEKGVRFYESLAKEVDPAIEFPIRNALDYMIQHKKIIERFGRFPHRNKILGRASTPEEVDFLKQPGSSF